MGIKKNESAPAVAVDVGRLSQGLKMTFRGVSEVFGAIGAEAEPVFEADGGGAASAEAAEAEAQEPVSKPEPKTKKSSRKKEPEQEPEPEKSDDAGTVKDEAEEAEAEPEPEEQGTQADADEAAQEEAKPEKPKKEPPKKTEFTLDDLMKVAATKVKQDKNNSGKIGALVKTYGVSSLKELPEDKWEAFMTDMSQL